MQMKQKRVASLKLTIGGCWRSACMKCAPSKIQQWIFFLAIKCTCVMCKILFWLEALCFSVTAQKRVVGFMTGAILVVEEHLQLPILPSRCRNKIKVRPQIIWRQRTCCAGFISELLCKCKKHYSDPHFCQGLFSPLQELFPALSTYVLSGHRGAVLPSHIRVFFVAVLSVAGGSL